jgi:predicted RNA-binding Zn-ribbon protein involved in translation (DUF1610 family)
MSDGISLDAKITCAVCDEEFQLMLEALDFECGNGGGERGMGPEYHYEARYFSECTTCGNEIEIEFNVWEYPVGIINNQEEKIIEGASEVTAEYEVYWEQEDEDRFGVKGKTPLKICEESIYSASEVLVKDYSSITQAKVLVMLHGYIVSAVEGYLFTTFLKQALQSEEKMQRLVEKDVGLGKQQISYKRLFEKKESIKIDLTKYLNGLIFHNIDKTRGLYKSVLGVEFGNAKWLEDAVLVRHDCVHRAGYTKEGEEVDLDSNSVGQLAQKSLEFVTMVDREIQDICFRS